MGVRYRKTLIRGAAVIAGAVLILGLSSTSAVAADRQQVSFSLIGLGGIAEIEERGPNHAIIDWIVYCEFGDYSGPYGFAANPALRMTWHWNDELGRGRVAGTLSTLHWFDPIRWEGEFRGQMTEAGGEGTLHMTEVHTGMKLRATWTMPALDPLGDVPSVYPVFEATGTVSG